MASKILGTLVSIPLEAYDNGASLPSFNEKMKYPTRRCTRTATPLRSIAAGELGRYISHRG